jgi:hypothetical protein
MKTRFLCAILAISVGSLGGCTSTTTTTTTQSQTDQTRKRLHTQEELKKSGQSEVGPALEKTDPAVRISR